jgi:anti-sigma B factor antagonist
MKVKITDRKKGQVTIIDVVGNLTIGVGDVALREKVNELLDADRRLFILNMKDVPFMDSAGLGETVVCNKRIRERGGAVKLVTPKGTKPLEVFIIAGLDKAFEIFDDEEEALASFIPVGVGQEW